MRYSVREADISIKPGVEHSGTPGEQRQIDLSSPRGRQWGAKVTRALVIQFELQLCLLSPTPWAVSYLFAADPRAHALGFMQTSASRTKTDSMIVDSA